MYIYIIIYIKKILYKYIYLLVVPCIFFFGLTADKTIIISESLMEFLI